MAAWERIHSFTRGVGVATKASDRITQEFGNLTPHCKIAPIRSGENQVIVAMRAAAPAAHDTWICAILYR